MALEWQHLTENIVKNGVFTIPHPSKVTSWADNMSIWPSITTSKIFSYFIDSMAVDGNAINNLKSSEAFQYLHSDKVGCALVHDMDSLIYLKADVQPSQSVNNSAHNAWVLVTKTGDVETAGCTCIAGPGRSHARPPCFGRYGSPSYACIKMFVCIRVIIYNRTRVIKIKSNPL